MPSLFGRTPWTVLAAVCLAPSVLLAYETDLSSEAVRDAYFLGQRHDDKTANFLKSYEQHFPLPKTGPYISLIQLLTPYSQIVETSRGALNYSAQRAQQDYQQRGDTIKICVRIEFTATYAVVETVPSGQRSGAEYSARLRSQDFWKDFRFGLSQNEHWLDPQEIYGDPIYAPTDLGSGTLSGALVWLIYDAKSVRSEPALVEVVSPDGSQKVDATFDLEKLR